MMKTNVENLWVGIWDYAARAGHAERAVEYLGRMYAAIIADRNDNSAVISIADSLGEVRWHLRLLNREIKNTKQMKGTES